MKRILAHSMLAIVLTACTTEGPAGPEGPRGAAGEAGPAGANAVIRVSEETTAAACTNGGHRVEAGADLDGDGVLADEEVTASTDVCDGTDGAPGPQGPTSAWQLVAADGYVFGKVTGLDGWLWNDTLGGFLPAPKQLGAELSLQGPPGLRVYFSGDCSNWQGWAIGSSDAYVEVGGLGPGIALADMLIPEVTRPRAGGISVPVWRVDWSAPAGPPQYPIEGFVDFPDGHCSVAAGPTDGLVPLKLVAGATTRHPGPATLQPVTD